jgi:hypothetical protein
MQVRHDEPRERQRALQGVRTVDDEQLVGVVGQLVEPTQRSRGRLERHVVAHREMLEVHQRADRPFRIGQRGAQALALLERQRLHHLLHDRRRQVWRDVGELVGLQRLHRGDQLGRVHRLDERLAHRVGHLDEDFAVAVGLDQVPHGEARLHRQRLEEVGDVGGVQGVELGAQAGEIAPLQDRLDFLQVLLQILRLDAGVTCALAILARMVPVRPLMYGVERPAR